MTELFVAGQDLGVDDAPGHADGRAIALASSGGSRVPLRRAVFLDRDGTINAMVYDRDHGLVDSPMRPDQLTLLPGAGAAVRQINDLGLLAIVVSNQPGVAKGKTSLALLEAMTLELRAQVAAEGGAVLDGIFYCLHHPEGAVEQYRVKCGCRKPGAGLLLQAARSFGIDLASSYMVGDGLNDVAAGREAGCRTVWLGSPRSDWAGAALAEGVPEPDWTARDLAEAIQKIVYLERRESAVDGDLRGFGRPDRDQAVGRVRRRRRGDDQPVHHAEMRSQ